MYSFLRIVAEAKKINWHLAGEKTGMLHLGNTEIKENIVTLNNNF